MRESALSARPATGGTVARGARSGRNGLTGARARRRAEGRTCMKIQQLHDLAAVVRHGGIRRGAPVVRRKPGSP